MVNILLEFKKYISPKAASLVDALIASVKQLGEAVDTGTLDGIEDILQDCYDITLELIPELPPQLQDATTDFANENEAVLQRFELGDGSIEIVRSHIDGVTTSLESALQEVNAETSDNDAVSNDNIVADDGNYFVLI